MIELHEVGLVEGLPPDVAKEPWVQILDAVFRERRKKELEAAERLKIYTDIDRADEAVLDILAVQFRVDWYDTSYPIETKRRIIKTALEVRRYCGTEWAVQKALSSIYPNVKISEWYDYGGRPGYWRMNVDITDDGVIYYTPEEIEKKAEVMEAALVGACEVPLEIMRTCAEAIDLIETFAEKGSKIAISDAGVGATLLKSALQGASLNIYINTKSMADKEAAASYNKEADELREKYEQKADEIFNRVCSKIR